LIVKVADEMKWRSGPLVVDDCSRWCPQLSFAAGRIRTRVDVLAGLLVSDLDAEPPR